MVASPRRINETRVHSAASDEEGAPLRAFRHRLVYSVLIALAAASLQLTAIPGAALAHSVDAANAQHGLRFASAGPCKGAYRIGDSGLCSHGVDPMPQWVRQRGGPAIDCGQASATGAAVGCDGDGVSGRRVQAVYAYVAGRTNRLSTFRSSMRSWASGVDAMFQNSARETGGTARLRWVTTNCLLNVVPVALTPQAESDVGAMIGELADLGFNRNDRKYLVWFDSDPDFSDICGISSIWNDDDPSANNESNQSVGYSRVDYGCWNFAESHELMHSLGGVQLSAPHSSGGWHCTDENDQMCYPDSPGLQMTYPCPSEAHSAIFDCGHDDYFDTSPAPGSYLDDHWNTARSGWIVGGQPVAPPNDDFVAATAVSGMSGSVTGSNVGASAESGEPANIDGFSPVHSVWYSWRAPATGDAVIDLCGSGFDTTVGVYAGSAMTSLSQVAADDDDAQGACGAASRVSLTVTSGALYMISVDGAAGEEGALTLHWLLTPTAPLDGLAPDVEVPAVSFVAGQQIGRSAIGRVTWPAASDPSGIIAYELQRLRGSGPWQTVPLATANSTSADVALRLGAADAFRVRATDGVGNVGPWSATSDAPLSRLEETSASISYLDTFKRVALTGASGGHVSKSRVSGGVASLTFTGSSVALASTTSRARGIAEISVDGGAWESVDLYSSATRNKVVVWATTLAVGLHTIEVRVTGTKNPAATNTRVDIDAFLVR